MLGIRRRAGDNFILSPKLHGTGKHRLEHACIGHCLLDLQHGLRLLGGSSLGLPFEDELGHETDLAMCLVCSEEPP